MKIYDISMEIREGMPVYKNKSEKRPKIAITRRLKEGANESRFMLESHTGTHADAFFHMLSNGKKINEMGLNSFIGNCVVLDFTKIKSGMITKGDFEKSSYNNKIKKNGIVLLKTREKNIMRFDHNFTYLEKTGAQFLANKKIKLVGIDNLGIERAQKNHETHKILFKKSIPVVEGLELSDIRPGKYFFIGMPLKISSDASPVRAVLVKR